MFNEDMDTQEPTQENESTNTEAVETEAVENTENNVEDKIQPTKEDPLQTYEKRIRDKDSYITSLQKQVKERERALETYTKYESVLSALKQRQEQNRKQEMIEKLQQGDISEIEKSIEEKVNQKLSQQESFIRNLQDERESANAIVNLRETWGENNIKNYGSFAKEALLKAVEFDESRGIDINNPQHRQNSYAYFLSTNPEELLEKAMGAQRRYEEMHKNKMSEQTKVNAQKHRQGMAPTGRTSINNQVNQGEQDLHSMPLDELEKLVQKSGYNTFKNL